MSGLTLLPIAYVSLAVFSAVVLFRTARIARAPVHLRWELAPIPHEKGKGQYGGSYFEEFEWWTQTTREVARQRSGLHVPGDCVPEGRLGTQPAVVVVFFSVPFRHVPADRRGRALARRRRSWAGRRADCGLGLAAHSRRGFGGRRLPAGRSGRGWDCSSADSSIHACGPSKRASALFNLGFLVAGFLERRGRPGGVRRFLAATHRVRPGAAHRRISIEMPGVLAVHLVLVFLFLAYLPFTPDDAFCRQVLHLPPGPLGRRAMTPGSRMEKEVTKLLQQPVTWSAPHLEGRRQEELGGHRDRDEKDAE